MVSARRDFMKGLWAAGIISASSASSEAALQPLPQAASPSTPASDETYKFWTEFLEYQSLPPDRNAAEVRSAGDRDVSGIDREPFFLHHGAQGLQAAMDIPATDLLPSGDVAVSVNVVAFRPADEDRRTFERLASAQLRVDFVQESPIVDVLDRMAWTALAVLHPDRANKLPPLENLSFDPGAAWEKMQNIILPGGKGSWAVNLFAQKKESGFAKFLGVLTKEVDRFAPALGLPEISRTALQAFNTVYGSLNDNVEHLFKCNPIPVFATSASMRASGGSRALPLRTGTYVLIPVAHMRRLEQKDLDACEVKAGLLVPRNTPSIEVHAAALRTLPAVTYATIDVNVRPAPLACGTGPRGQNPGR